MPLMRGKSPKSFSHNVEAEMHAGKPKDQALAIAYSIKRKNMAKGGYPVSKDPNYAHGGEVESEEHREHEASMVDPMSIVKSLRMKRMAAGGEVDDDFLSDEENTALPDETEAPDDRKKRLLAKAFEMVRARHSGK